MKTGEHGDSRLDGHFVWFDEILKGVPKGAGEMHQEDTSKKIDELKMKYPNKFATEEKIFRQIRRGDRIFVGTGCGGPQYLTGP